MLLLKQMNYGKLYCINYIYIKYCYFLSQLLSPVTNGVLIMPYAGTVVCPLHKDTQLSSLYAQTHVE